MIDQHYLKDTLLQLRKYKEMAEKAMAQISDNDFFRELSDIDNSLAIIVKHMAGNMSAAVLSLPKVLLLDLNKMFMQD